MEGMGYALLLPSLQTGSTTAFSNHNRLSKALPLNSRISLLSTLPRRWCSTQISEGTSLMQTMQPPNEANGMKSNPQRKV